nr:triple tyrosine motif-containing protein [uncultured Duganella sp.]
MKFILLLALLCCGAQPVSALEVQVALSDYQHDIWTGKDGAPGEVAAMAQTADGWLWIAGSNGLYRFDGLRFSRFEALSGEVAPRRPITALTALRDGDLLIGYIYGGMSLLSKGHLTHYPSLLNGKLIGPVSSAVRDADGVLWAATTTNGLLQLKDGAWRDVGPEMDLPKARLSNIIIDQYEQMWLAAGDQLMLLARGAQRFRAVLSGYQTVNLSAAPDGRLWLDTHAQLIPVPPQHQGPDLPRPAWLAQAEGQENGLFDRDGNYWMLGCPGVCRSDGAGLRASVVQTPIAHPDSKLDQPWQVSSLIGNLLFEDRDGNLWVGTQSGVERFRNKRLARTALSGGARVLLFARDVDGNALAMAKPGGEVWRLRAGAAAELAERMPPGPVGGLANAADGALLVAGASHIERRYRDRSERIAYPADPADASSPSPVPVTRLMDDGRDLWLTISRRGTFRLHEGRWQPQAELGVPEGVFFLAAGAPGTVWFGYNDGLVLHYTPQGITRYAPRAEDDIGAITFLHAGAGVVAAGAGGLAVLRDGAFQRLRAADPEVLLRISGMVIGADGDRWFNGGKGVVHVSAADWQAALAAPRQPLRYVLYGVLDGYPGFAATAGRQPSAMADAQGQLWFAGAGGLAHLDSTRVPVLPPPPLVKMELLEAAGGRHLDFSRPLVLAPGTTAFRIEYTALSYSMPEALRFRYQLEGVDREWQDAGARRAVSYTNLGPGQYRFRVAAVNQFGQWNQQQSTLSVRILPTFTQTPLFFALCALAAAALLYLLYRWWLRQATLRLATRMAERERIARALHDSFLQSVHGLTLSVQSVLGSLPAGSAAHQKIERVLRMADKVMEEGRDEVLDLRSGAMGDGDLAHGLTLVGEVLQESHRAVFSLRSAGQPRRLDEQVACECYSIGREALLNAFRHADAAAIQVELDYGDAQFSLRVLDDGKGIAPEVARKGSAGHWGVTGMFERAGHIGGQVTLDNLDGGGTRLLLSVPAARAYVAPAGWKRRWRFWFR